jgi:hypothetical protein
MAFTKTSVGLTAPKAVDSPIPSVGEEKEGKVWDGEKWVTKEEWDSSQAGPSSKLPGTGDAPT